jgi:hypothetical protein
MSVRDGVVPQIFFPRSAMPMLWLSRYLKLNPFTVFLTVIAQFTLMLRR